MIPEPARQVIVGMRSALEIFTATPNVYSLNRLVGTLSGAIDALVGDVDPDWLEELRSAWWPLEFVNATVLSEERQTLRNSEIESVTTARDEFLALLVEY
jgi:hypothetical protein